MSAGSASPADAQTRNRSGTALRKLRVCEQRGEERRNAVEDRRLMPVEPRDDRRRGGPLRHQHGRRTDRHRKRQRIAQTIREEELRGGVHDIVLAYAEHRLRIELRGQNEARVRVHRALGRARRARRIEPEARVVAGRLGRRARRRRGIHQRRERVGRPGLALAWRTGDDHVTQVWMHGEHRRNRREQRRGHDQRARPAVAQHVVVVAGRQQRVRGDGHDARLDRAEKHGGEVDGVEEAEQHALLGPHAERRQRVGAPIHPFRQLAVRVRPCVVDIGDLAGASRGEVALDEVVRRVVIARDVDPRRAGVMIGGAERRHRALLRAPRRPRIRPGFLHHGPESVRHNTAH